MNIFLYELKSYRKSTIIWTTSLVLISIFFLSIFPVYASNADELKNMFAMVPPEIPAAFGIDINTFFTMLGFYKFVFLYVILCGAIQAMNIGLSITSKENRSKTADFLLSKPVSRVTILNGKICSVLTSLLLTNIVYTVVSTIAAIIISAEEFDITIFILISITMLFIQILFASLGFLLGIVKDKIKNVLSISLSVVFSFFVIDMVGSALSLDAIKYFSPFKYFDINYIINNSAYELSFFILWMALVVIFISLSYFVYVKKDIHSV